jgi:DNA-binding LytR/AlgR family response regulator
MTGRLYMQPVLKILICDDELPIARQIASVTDTTLQNTEHRIVICNTEAELFSSIRKDSLSIALLDIELSGSKSGIELAG